MFKKKIKKEKTELPKCKNFDYEQAKQEFLDGYRKQSKVIHTWKMLSFLLAGIVVISITGVLYLSTRGSLIPYVIEVDEVGNAKGINPAYQITYEPTEANIQYYLREFVKNSRWLSSDEVLQGSFYLKAISLLNKDTKEKYDAVVESENWSEMIRAGFTRDVQIESINKVAGTKNSYQVRWIETVYKKGVIVDTIKILAIYSIAIEPPKDLEELKTNPLGIRIQDYHVSIEK